MPRHRFTFLSALSLALCAATCVMWVRSYRNTDGFLYFSDQYTGWVADTENGSAEFGYLFVTAPQTLPPIKSIWFHRGERPPIFDNIVLLQSIHDPYIHRFSFLGARLREDREYLFKFNGPVQLRTFTAEVPFWFLAIFTALLPTRTFLIRIFRKTGQTGHCLHCGYDLRATTERCPECGTVTTPAGGK